MGGWCIKTQKFVVVLATVAVASCVVLDLVSHGDAYFRLGTHRLGPGSGEWLVEAPEVHDLRATRLQQAANHVDGGIVAVEQRGRRDEPGRAREIRWFHVTDW